MGKMNRMKQRSRNSVWCQVRGVTHVPGQARAAGLVSQADGEPFKTTEKTQAGKQRT